MYYFIVRYGDSADQGFRASWTMLDNDPSPSREEAEETARARYPRHLSNCRTTHHRTRNAPGVPNGRTGTHTIGDGA